MAAILNLTTANTFLQWLDTSNTVIDRLNSIMNSNGDLLSTVTQDGNPIGSGAFSNNYTYGITVSNTVPHFTVNATSAATASIFIQRQDAQLGLVRFKTGNASTGERWALGVDATAEDNNAQGSDFVIRRYSNTGVLVGTPLSISRRYGTATFANNIILGLNQQIILDDDADTYIDSDLNNRIRFFTGGTRRLLMTSSYNNFAQPINIAESATVSSIFTGSGQIWVKDDTPNILKFTDDAGTDFTPAMLESANIWTANQTIQLGSTGGTAYTGSDNLVLEETGDHAGIAILSESAYRGYVSFGDPAGNPGWMSYLHTGDRFEFATGGSPRLRLASAGLYPESDDLIPLGLSGTGFSDLFLASGAVINFDAGDVTLTHSPNHLSIASANVALGLNQRLILDDDLDSYIYSDTDDNIRFVTSGSNQFGVANDKNWSWNPLFIGETAAAASDTAGWGQLWVKDDTPNNLYFTDDTGKDIQLTDNGQSASGPSLGSQGIMRFNYPDIGENITVRDNNVSFANSSVHVANDTITVGSGHGFLVSQRVQFSAGGVSTALPAPITANTNYYIETADSTTIKVAANSTAAALNITNNGTATIHIYRCINASSVGPITILPSNTVTIANGCTWSIV